MLSDWLQLLLFFLDGRLAAGVAVLWLLMPRAGSTSRSSTRVLFRAAAADKTDEAAAAALDGVRRVRVASRGRNGLVVMVQPDKKN